MYTPYPKLDYRLKSSTFDVQRRGVTMSKKGQPNASSSGESTACIELYSFLDQYIDKKVNIRLITGTPKICTIRRVSAYEVLVEEGTSRGTPVTKLLFKHAIVSIEPV